MSRGLRHITIIVIVVAALILLYGFFQARGYENGSDEGYSSALRGATTACLTGTLLGDEFCDKVDATWYGNGTEEDYMLAQAAVNVNATVTGAKKPAAKPVIKPKKPAKALNSRQVISEIQAGIQTGVQSGIEAGAQAGAQASAQAPNAQEQVLQPPPPPPEKTPWQLRQEKASAVTCSKATTQLQCTGESPFDTYCTWTGACVDSNRKLSLMYGDEACKIVADRLVGAHRLDPASDPNNTICVDVYNTLAIRIVGGRPLGDSGQSLGALLTGGGNQAEIEFAKKNNIKPITVIPTVSLPLCSSMAMAMPPCSPGGPCMPPPMSSMPQPGVNCTPDAPGGMMGGCMSPMRTNPAWNPSNPQGQPMCITAASQQSFFASLAELITDLFRRP